LRAERESSQVTRAPSPRPRTRPHLGVAVAAPGLLVWEETPGEAAWARDLAAFARALPRPRMRMR